MSHEAGTIAVPLLGCDMAKLWQFLPLSPCRQPFCNMRFLVLDPHLKLECQKPRMKSSLCELASETSCGLVLVRGPQCSVKGVQFRFLCSDAQVNALSLRNGRGRAPRQIQRRLP